MTFMFRTLKTVEWAGYMTEMFLFFVTAEAEKPTNNRFFNNAQKMEHK